MADAPGHIGKVLASCVVLGILGTAIYTTTGEKEVGALAARATPATTTRAQVTPVPEVAPVRPVSAAPSLNAGPPCVADINANVEGLVRALAAGGTWTSHKDELTDLVQDTINCDFAEFEAHGDFAALDTNEADLSILWSPSQSHLTMTTFADGAVAPDLPPLQADDISLVFR